MRNAALALLCSLTACTQAAMPETATCSGHATVGCSAAWTDGKALNDGNGDRAGPGDRGR